MSRLHETAYPRFKPDITGKEIEECYTPTSAELVWAHINRFGDNTLDMDRKGEPLNFNTKILNRN